MSTELIAIVGLSAALAGLILNGQRLQGQEIKDLRGEMRQGIKYLRGEMRRGIKALREEIREKIKGLCEEINDLRERMARLEGLLEGLREAISGRRAA